MIQNYKIVTLCGSTRFKEQFMEAQKRLTLQGCIVISVGLFGHSGDNDVCITYQIDVAPELKASKMQILDAILNEMSYEGFEEIDRTDFWTEMTNLQKAKIIR